LSQLMGHCFSSLALDRDVAVTIAVGLASPPTSLFGRLAEFAPRFRAFDTVFQAFDMASALTEM
jgi:hypothetical protein